MEVGLAMHFFPTRSAFFPHCAQEKLSRTQVVKLVKLVKLPPRSRLWSEDNLSTILAARRATIISRFVQRVDGEDAKVQCVLEWMIAVPLQRVALGSCKDFHTASSFSLVVQEDCRNDLERKKNSIDSIFLLGWKKNQEIGAKH